MDYAYDIRFNQGVGDSICFLHDLWVGDIPLSRRFPLINNVVMHKDALMADYKANGPSGIFWDITMRRRLNDWRLRSLKSSFDPWVK